MGKGGDKVFRATVSVDEVSDRPVWAGVKGGKAGGGSKKGDLFGDMVMLLRDANGVPILTPTAWCRSSPTSMTRPARWFR